MAVVLPFIIFSEATEMFAKFLKRQGIYDRWDRLHSLLVFLVILFLVLYYYGAR